MGRVGLFHGGRRSVRAVYTALVRAPTTSLSEADHVERHSGSASG